MLRKPTEGQDIVADYQSLGLTLGRHPMQLLRHRLDRYRYLQAERYRTCRPARLSMLRGSSLPSNGPARRAASYS